MPIDADLADFFDECGWRSTTLANARSILGRWQRWLGDRTPMQATHRDLKAYLVDRQAADIGPSTIHKEWQVITAVYAWAARPVGGELVTAGRYRGKRLPGAGLLDANPMLRVPEPFVPHTPKVRYAGHDDVATLIDYFAKLARERRGGEKERALRNAAMVSLMFRSGCRVGELPWIELCDVVRDGDGRILAVYVGGRDGRHAKNGNRRLVPVTDETPRLLERYLRRRGLGEGPLFVGRDAHTVASDGRLQTNAIRIFVRRAAKRCNVTISPHDMRRGWAVESKRRGVDNVSIKQMAGWSNDTIMNRYFGPEREVLALEAFHAAAARNNGASSQRLRLVN